MEPPYFVLFRFVDTITKFNLFVFRKYVTRAGAWDCDVWAVALGSIIGSDVKNERNINYLKKYCFGHFFNFGFEYEILHRIFEVKLLTRE